jgi:hypothetical protein
MALFETDRFDRADVDARAAIAAGVGIDDRQTVFHRNRIQRAGLHACFASGTLFRVNYCCHETSPNDGMELVGVGVSQV